MNGGEGEDRETPLEEIVISSFLKAPDAPDSI
jgi:hypothetical protein